MAMLGDNAFYEIALLVLLAAGVGFLGLLLRQPLIVGFIAVGVLAGPDVLGLVSSADFIETLSQFSIAVLLFLVGLKLDVGLVRSLGRVSLATGLGQVGFTAAVGFLICLGLGLDALTALYVAVALTFSSTIIIVKLLSDKREINALHGKIALGFLIVQDLFVVLCMVVLSAVGVGADETAGGGARGILGVIAGGLVMLGLAGLFIRYGAEALLRRVARSPELLVIFAVGWAAGFAAAGDAIGLGKEIGGLVAGVSLASTPYREAIASRLASLRDFLLLFFFIDLGAGLALDDLGTQVGAAAVLSLFVLIGNPLIVLAIMGYLGYRKRTGFLAGLTVAQISEFSLIFMAMGVAIGHVDEEALGLVTLVGLVTIALSVYMISYSHSLFRIAEPLLGPFERRMPHREETEDSAGAGRGEYDYVLFGLGRFGSRIGRGLIQEGYRVLGVDFDPDALRQWKALGLPGEFGDATDPEFIAHLPLHGVQGVISAIPRDVSMLTEADHQVALMEGLQAAGFAGSITLTAGSDEDGRRLRAMGAHQVLNPYDDAAKYAVGAVIGGDVRSAEARRA